MDTKMIKTDADCSTAMKIANRKTQTMKGLKNDPQFHHYYLGTLITEFNSEMKENIREAFKDYVEYIRELTDGFNPDKERDVRIAFNYKRDYREELKAFVISNGDEDILDEVLKERTIDNEFILETYMFDLAKENNVKITVYNGRVFINKRPYETDAMVLMNTIPSHIDEGYYFITHEHFHNDDSTYYCVGYDGHFMYLTFNDALSDALACKRESGVQCHICKLGKNRDFEIVNK